MSQDHDVNDRVAFMGLDERARQALRALRPLIRKEIGPALAAFYGKVKTTPQTSKFFKDDRHIDAASKPTSPVNRPGSVSRPVARGSAAVAVREEWEEF